MDQYQSPIEQVACVDQTSPPIVQAEHMSGPTLVPEIIRMIIELLLNPRSRQSIAPLRLVSKLFNALVTPLLYRYGGLDRRAVRLLVSSSDNPVPHEAQIARDMRIYSRDVNLIAELDITTLQMENTVSRT